MSLHIDFEPHSWYKGFAIQKVDLIADPESPQRYWYGVTANGMTGYLVEFEQQTLRELKEKIKGYTLFENARIRKLYE